MSQLSDQDMRQEALNPQYSYIVQAPAGSGKTELLTQRFLKLLSQVDNPESIIALTFTKKAAREMRDRILLAIEKVHNHEKNSQPETDKLALLVLIQDKKNNWQLLQSPNRLKILTIDALCSSLVGKMPILSQGAPFTTIAKDPFLLYKEAAQRCLIESQQDADKSNNPSVYQKALKTLLLHLGNHYGRCVQLLADMLSWREQWLSHIIPAQALSSDELRKKLELALTNITQESEMHLEELFSEEIKDELMSLLEFSENNIAFNKNNNDINYWKKIANLLLTQENTWRSRIDKNLGFPSPSESKNPEEKNYLKSMKMRLEAILLDLRENAHASEKYRLALESYRHLPPTFYSENQWAILEALITLLPLLAAQLKIIFMERGQTDFSEISEQATFALGELDNPSELALYLDYSIQHLLIDEFQDTSLKQFRLLEKLIEGWEPDDGRTLFIVGDPMQSIYRFREADVSLFLQARQSGIGNIQLKSLTLDSNFRSRPELIEWVNLCFKAIFPPKDDIALSAITHHASKAGRQAYDYDNDANVNGNATHEKIHFYTHETAEEQALSIIQSIQNIKENESIGILVRSRAQLKKILPALQQANIAFQGTDIDLLSTRSCIQDLCFLTQTLLQPENQLAWLAVLRSPWCGLTTSDLLAIQKHKLSADLSKISEDGKSRFTHTKNIIIRARKQRQKESLATWVEQTWRDLGGYLCIQEKDHSDIERFWELLDEYSYEDLDISRDLFKKVSQLYSNTPQKSRLSIMTIHKSKGLEFDHIVLPHLEANSGKKDYPLLQHLERRTVYNQIHGQNELILTTMKSIETQQDEIYKYLHYLDSKKEIFERQRLLYVALTRAKKHIHLFAVQADSEREASNNTFLKWLSPFLPNQSNTTEVCRGGAMWAPAIEINQPSSGLKRLKNIYCSIGGRPQGDAPTRFCGNANNINAQNIINDSNPINTEIENPLFRITGTFIHEQIQICAENHFTEPSQLNTQFWKNRLIELGLYSHEEQGYAINTTHLAVNNLFADPRGQWILRNHESEKNEYALTYFDQNAIMDRTFVAPDIDSTKSCRWIIDYKITQENLQKGSISLDFAAKEYHIQLEKYAKLFSKIEKNPIYLALYYPISQTWIAWPYIPC